MYNDAKMTIGKTSSQVRKCLQDVFGSSSRRPVSSSVTYTEGIPERMRHSGYIQYTYRRRHDIFSSPVFTPTKKNEALQSETLQYQVQFQFSTKV